MSDLISIVVPVYNVENYLNRCIDSILAQSYQNLEIVLVEDGSTDSCPQLCDGWAARDSRIRVFHKHNAGLGMARNTGLDHAAGVYVMFVDSDDYILPHTVEKAYSLAKETAAEIVLFGMNHISGNGVVMSQRIPTADRLCYEGAAVQEEILPALLRSHPNTYPVSNLPNSACTGLYAMDMIRCTRWRFVSEREILSEDIYSLLELYKDVRSVAVLTEACYCYCENPDSLTRVYRSDRFEKACDCYLQCVALCRKNGYSAKTEHCCIYSYLGSVTFVMKQTVASLSFRAARKRIREILNSDILQNVIYEQNPEPYSVQAKVLFWTMKKKYASLCWFLIYLQLLRQRLKV